MRFEICPRCGEFAFETLKTHDFCWNCNYSSDFERDPDPASSPIPKWAAEIADSDPEQEAVA